MNAPRYITNNLANQFQKQQEYKNHQKRLQEIKTKRAKTLQSTETSSSLDLQSKQKMRFLKQQMGKLNVINKENEVLLERLVCINQGKSKTFVQKEGDESLERVLQKKADACDIQRRQQEQRIREENTLIVKRLVERIQKNEQMSKEQRQRAITEYLKQRKLMQKYNNYQAEPHRTDLNISTDHNDISRLAYNHHNDDSNHFIANQSSDLKLPPLNDSKGNQAVENTNSQPSHRSKQVIKSGQKTNVNSSHKNNHYIKTNIHLNTETNSASNNSSTTINNNNNNQQSRRQNINYNYIEQNSALYHYEDKTNSKDKTKSNSTNKKQMKEMNLLNNILQDCCPEIETNSNKEQQKQIKEQSKPVKEQVRPMKPLKEQTLNQIEQSKSVNLKQQIQTNESQENMNISKTRKNININKHTVLESLNTQQDTDQSNPSHNREQHPLKPINNSNNLSHLNNLNNQPQSHRMSSQNKNSNGNPSLIQHKNSSQGQSNKQKQLPQSIRSSSERIGLESNQKVYKDKRRVSNNLSKDEGKSSQIGYNPQGEHDNQENLRSIMSKKNSAQIIENEEINMEDTYEIKRGSTQINQQVYDSEIDEQIKTDQDEAYIDLDHEHHEDNEQIKGQSKNESYNFYKSKSNMQSDQKSNRYKLEDANDDNEMVIDDDDHDFNS